MILTDEKISVTHKMMVDNGMYRELEYGVPLDPHNPNKGLEWKSVWSFKEKDFENIEKFFLRKEEQTEQNNNNSNK